MDLKTIKELRVLQGMARQSMERLKTLTEKLGTAHQKLVETAAKLDLGRPSEEKPPAQPERKVSSTLSMAPWPEWDD